MSKLSTWAERMIRQVDEESGTLTSRITLTTVDGGALWETWDAPIELERFLAEAEATKAQLATEFPKRRVAIMWTAVDANANIRGQSPDHILGQNAQAADLTAGGPRALVESMDAQARTMDKILKSAEIQCTSLTKTVETISGALNGMYELQTAKMEAEIVKKEAETSTEKVIAEQVKNAAPMIMELLMHLIQNAKPASPVAQAAQAIAGAVMNGHSSTGIAQS